VAGFCPQLGIRIVGHPSRPHLDNSRLGLTLSVASILSNLKAVDQIRDYHTSSSPEQTEAVGAQFASRLTPGDVVLVRGELSAGKTTLIRGALRALGVIEPVTSPTYAIGATYRGSQGTCVSHLDLYRLDQPQAEDPGLFEEYFDSATISFVEWPERGVSEWLEDGTATIYNLELVHGGADQREIRISA
jgi:tRNA threonylcarbamoyladenosine biosynthesis protein TsaE